MMCSFFFSVTFFCYDGGFREGCFSGGSPQNTPNHPPRTKHQPLHPPLLPPSEPTSSLRTPSHRGAKVFRASSRSPPRAKRWPNWLSANSWIAAWVQTYAVVWARGVARQGAVGGGEGEKSSKKATTSSESESRPRNCWGIWAKSR